MSVVLSASVRQNLLSLQSTADLLATTQNRLSSGKKVNSALDNPTNFFTAAGLDSRASDINNLLDGIGNGVQILQAANTGITSLQKLVDTAKSIANQALQSTVGYSTKSNVSTTVAGATSDDLRGTTTFANAAAASNVLYSGAAGGTTAVAGTSLIGGLAGALTGAATTNVHTASPLGTAAGTTLYSAAGVPAASGTALSALTDSAGTAAGFANNDTLTFGGKTITFQTGSAALAGSGSAFTLGIGATVDDLRAAIDTVSGTTTPSTLSAGVITVNTTAADLTFTGSALAKSHLPAAPIVRTNSTPGLPITAATKLFDVTSTTSDALGATPPVSDGDVMTVNGKTITFRAAAVPTGASIPSGYGVTGNVATDGTGNSIVYIGASATTTAATVGDVETAIDFASGVKTATIAAGVATPATAAGQTPSSVSPTGVVSLSTTTGGDLTIGGKADLLHAFGLTAATGGAVTTLTAARSSGAGSTGSLIQAGSTLNVNGKVITFVDESVPLPGAVAAGSGVSGNIVTDSTGNSKVYLRSANVNDVLNAIDLATGTKVASNVGGTASVTTTAGSTASFVNSSGTLNISTGLTSDLTISGTGNALSALGLAGNTGSSTVFNAPRAAGPGGINGTTLTFSSFKGGTPVNVTFGDGTNGTVKTLAQLNAALLANNMTASVDSTGKLVITTGNDYASSTLGSTDGGAIGGTLTSALSFTTAAPPVADLTSQNARATLVAQYNNVITQITTTSQDASFNGVNLLAGDTLKLVFNETGKSTLNITGTALTPAGLGVPTLTAGTDFIDNASANKVLAALNVASTTLRSQASTLGSNLSIVQIRQDFSKNLINVLSTGSSNLTLADTNEEAANSQALSTRQSIAVSALALANQSQQSVLKLLQ